MQFPKHANANDAKVATFILKQAIVKNDWMISVNDGEEWVVKNSIDEDKISAAMMSTDNDTLNFKTHSGQPMGTIWLVYGNNGECFADASSDNGGAFDAFTQCVMDKTDEVTR